MLKAFKPPGDSFISQPCAFKFYLLLLIKIICHRDRNEDIFINIMGRYILEALGGLKEEEVYN